MRENFTVFEGELIQSVTCVNEEIMEDDVHG